MTIHDRLALLSPADRVILAQALGVCPQTVYRWSRVTAAKVREVYSRPIARWLDAHDRKATK